MAKNRIPFMFNKLVICAFLFCAIPFSGFSLVDSTDLKVFTNEFAKGKVFIVHKVDKGQSLYAISKRYGVSIDDIYAYNPELKANGLKADQFIFIITKYTAEQGNWIIKKRKLEADSIAAYNEKQDNGLAAPKSNQDNVIYYTAKLGQTLFAISRLEQCQFSVEELKKWNNLKSNDIKEGDRLIIGFRKEVVIEDSIPKDPDGIKTIVDGTGSDAKNKTSEKKDTVKKVVWKDIQLEGLASWQADGNKKSRVSFALYNGATPGTVIRVLNLSNQKITYVRVAGPIANSDNKDVILVVSETAAKRLGVDDKYFRVRIIYATEDI